MEKYRKAFVHAIGALKVLQDEFVDLRQVLHNSLKQTIRNMLGVRERDVEHGRKFCLDVVSSSKALDFLSLFLM